MPTLSDFEECGKGDGEHYDGPPRPPRRALSPGRRRGGGRRGAEGTLIISTRRPLVVAARRRTRRTRRSAAAPPRARVDGRGRRRGVCRTGPIGAAAGAAAERHRAGRRRRRRRLYMMCPAPRPRPWPPAPAPAPVPAGRQLRCCGSARLHQIRRSPHPHDAVGAAADAKRRGVEATGSRLVSTIRALLPEQEGQTPVLELARERRGCRTGLNWVPRRARAPVGALSTFSSRLLPDASLDSMEGRPGALAAGTAAAPTGPVRHLGARPTDGPGWLCLGPPLRPSSRTRCPWRRMYTYAPTAMRRSQRRCTRPQCPGRRASAPPPPSPGVAWKLEPESATPGRTRPAARRRPSRA